MKEFQAYPVEINGDEVTFRFSSTDAAQKFQNVYNLFNPSLIEIQVRDSREISAKQRRFIYAIFRDISNWSGYDPSIVKSSFKFNFEYVNEIDEFSLRNVEKSVANEFITYMLFFIVEHNIPLRFQPLEAIVPEDIAHFEYACLMNKCCVICGTKPSDLHHLDTIGQGIDRRKTNHLKHRAVQLCRIHHNLAHSLGIETFMRRFKINGIKIDEKIALAHGLNMR